MARSVRAIGLAGMVVVVLAACGGPDLSTVAVDACNMFASRTAEAPVGTERADLMDAMAPSVEEADEKALKDAYEVLAAAEQGDATQWREAVAAFSKTCISLGWELPEG
ncbi:hypothetical protein [Cellulomonas shaoxiangyii]|uniref:Lipoprotein n=1 Tax=Cellulomonas shaoxiangyii TaxID=2566013 RepID=A0A4P7SP18_9CELL|nr:hypothetical protein [Cellulomonas shaoxiangyii]QCB94714.1 hypothetical protein E5225_15275 [Cellulomonas shaoxiangyii]TGY85050.1 hypothetical protein E5226_08250 [Cellulomonas shaoxiangyii]